MKILKLLSILVLILILITGCSNTTVTQTVTEKETITNTQTETVWGTVTKYDKTTLIATETEWKFVCPIDTFEFNTLAELQTHFESTYHGSSKPALAFSSSDGNVTDYFTVESSSLLIRYTGNRSGNLTIEAGYTLPVSSLPVVNGRVYEIEVKDFLYAGLPVYFTLRITPPFIDWEWVVSVIELE
ncbi:hypothetical protein ACFLYB_07245 [Chloroflexota bacterium]